jgi:parvulin-like peptidyl-prolyl isomerase
MAQLFGTSFRKFTAVTLTIATVATISVSLIGCGNGSKANEPVVTINETLVVTRGEYNKLYTKMVKQANLDPKTLVTAPEDSQEAQLAEQIKQYTLNKLIFSTLVENAATEANVEVTKEELDAFRKEQLESIGGEEALTAMLEAKDMTKDEFNEALTEQLLIRQFVDEHLAPKLAEGKGNLSLDISDAEAKQFYNSQKPLFYRTEGVKASHILLKVIPGELKAEFLKKSPNLSKEELDNKVAEVKAEKKADAEKLLAKVKEDPSKFNELAKANSEDTFSAIQGGKLDTLYEPMTDPKFWEASQQATVGDIYPELVESAFGYHILLVHKRIPAGQQSFSDVKDDIQKVLKQQRRQQILMEWVTEQRKGIQLEYAEGYQPEKPETAEADDKAPPTVEGNAPASAGKVNAQHPPRKTAK